MGIKRNGGGFKPGDMKTSFGATIEAGWLACGGQAVSRATYAALFLAIGTTYGAGDGSTTFNLPDARGRALFGKDDMGGTPANRLTNSGSGVQGATLGASGGGESITLSATEMPTHTHIQNAHSHTQQGANGSAGATSYMSATSANNSGLAAFTNTPTAQSTPTNQNNGSSGAHRNIPPALVVNLLIKV